MEDELRKSRFTEFIKWFDAHITGRERREGQIFFDRLLRAFGNPGVLEVGATLEDPVKKKTGRTGFADFVWKPRVIVELKERGTDLKKHYHQAEEYWFQLVPDRPEYMCLCNFDEFWIFDLNQQLMDPVHKLSVRDLPNNWGPLAFLFPTKEKPIFGQNHVEVTKEAAHVLGNLYQSLSNRGVSKRKAQRFVLQLVVALFSEDVGLIPKYTINKILKKAVKEPVSQSELAELFSAMCSRSTDDKPSKYRDIAYFNGGLFNQVEPVELSYEEIGLLDDAAQYDWSKVRPSIFGSLFEGSMDPKKRHGHGVHYTHEIDIQKIVGPTIVRPFLEKISKAGADKKALEKILAEVRALRVLDPACGSGNFLYVAFRELRRIEADLIERMNWKDDKRKNVSQVTPLNFFGIDINEFGLELAKVALFIGRKLSSDEFAIQDDVLPFQNLDANFHDHDALLNPWPAADVIIGNPPYLSSKKMKVELPNDYVKKVRRSFAAVPGRADYCVYWFRKAHDHLPVGGRAGLVGTNTIRQNYSREGGLDYIVANNGTITEAVSTQVWTGDAVVHVSIVNWIKGETSGEKRLYMQNGDRIDSPWTVFELNRIPASLTEKTDVTGAMNLKCNQEPKFCFVGQAPQSEGFYLSPSEYMTLARTRNCQDVLFPFLIGRELLSRSRQPERYVIDFGQRTLLEAQKFGPAFERVRQTVLPDVQRKAKNEEDKTGEKGDWHAHLQNWWHHWRGRPDLIAALSKISRYIVVSRVTKRPIFEFVDSEIHPGDALIAFPFEDDYSFGILQSRFHTDWFKARCSTLKGDYRYTGDTVFDTFPWPQKPSAAQIRAIANASLQMRRLRNSVMHGNNWGLKELYKSLDLPGNNPLKDAQAALDSAVAEAYGYNGRGDLLAFILNLNRQLFDSEAAGHRVQGPGLPSTFKEKNQLITDDAIRIAGAVA